MTAPSRRVAITKKVSLASFAEGWDNCYAIVTLADVPDLKEIETTDLKGLTNLQMIDFEINVVKKHFVSGKIMLLGADGSQGLADMTTDDLTAIPSIADHLYAMIMGIDLDPKGSKTSTETPAPASPNSTNESSPA